MSTTLGSHRDCDDTIQNLATLCANVAKLAALAEFSRDMHTRESFAEEARFPVCVPVEGLELGLDAPVSHAESGER